MRVDLRGVRIPAVDNVSALALEAWSVVQGMGSAIAVYLKAWGEVASVLLQEVFAMAVA